ncbi:MAG: SDR family NAD(P)-dependent oxidoreductase, partial [Proteobacteria bacterium]|nr:SDR family NAD(P)-dependent oxidoreductase [Pseudomonadota bacterium]
VTGGLGALGLELATWLVDQGAGHLVLLGRSGPSLAASELLAGLRASGTRIDVVSVDVTDKAALGAVTSGLDLGGVFHCAGVLDDALIAEQSPQRVARVAGVKTTGAWNLHELVGDVEHFVLFSSVSGVVGSAGQASYAAANSWLDALAAWRRNQGLSALSVAWGPWAAVGMAATTEGKGRWSRVGISELGAGDALTTMGALMAADVGRAAVLPIDRAKMARGLSLGPIPPLMLELLEQQEGGDERAEERRELRDEVLSSEDPEDRFNAMVDYLCVCLATVTEEDEVDPEAPLDDNDSLVAVEFTALVEKELGLSLPMEEVFELENLMDVAEMIVEMVENKG